MRSKMFDLQLRVESQRVQSLAAGRPAGRRKSSCPSDGSDDCSRDIRYCSLLSVFLVRNAGAIGTLRPPFLWYVEMEHRVFVASSRLYCMRIMNGRMSDELLLSSGGFMLFADRKGVY